MDEILTPNEIRILGCLIEKEHTTPEYYPLTLNALLTAANQKSNRNPILRLDESEVHKAIDGLRQKGLLWKKMIAGSRVPKYEHALLEKYRFNEAEVALLCSLFLRGPQTPGELKSHTARLYTFDSLDEVQDTLQELLEGDDPIVVRLPVQPGRKEARFHHLFGGEPEVEDNLALFEQEHSPAPTTGTGSRSGPASQERITQLEDRLTALTEQVQRLQEQLDRFVAEFE